MEVKYFPKFSLWCFEWLADESTADDGYLFIWSSDGSIFQQISPKQGPITVVQWLNYPHVPQTHFLISGRADGTVKLWKKIKGQVLSVLYLLVFWVECALCTEHLSICCYVSHRWHGYWKYRAGRYSPCSCCGREIFHFIFRNQPPWSVKHIYNHLIRSIHESNYNQDVFRIIITEPKTDERPFSALARSVHFFNASKSLMVGFLDAKEMWETSGMPTVSSPSHDFAELPGVFHRGPDCGSISWQLACVSIHYFEVQC